MMSDGKKPILAKDVLPAIASAIGVDVRRLRSVKIDATVGEFLKAEIQFFPGEQTSSPLGPVLAACLSGDAGISRDIQFKKS